MRIRRWSRKAEKAGEAGEVKGEYKSIDKDKVFNQVEKIKYIVTYLIIIFFC